MSSDKQRIVSALRATEFDVVDATILRLVAELLCDPEVEPEQLRDVAVHLLRMSDAHGSPLDHALLRNTVVTDRAFELQLRARRRTLYESASALDAEEIVSIAMQAELTAFAWPDDRDITRDGRNWMDVLLRAMYEPLHLIPGTRELDRASMPEDVASFIASRLAAVDEEDAILASLQRDVHAPDDVVRSVRDQYESAPFPRWTRLRPRVPRSLADDVARRLDTTDLPPLRDAARVLIAGCGTGQDAIQAAWRYAPAEVVAIDISARSLAIASRLARAHGMANIEFVHADLLSFESPSQAFDVIESTGVLHHLPDPEAGLHHLATLLRPRGVIALALYSRAARAPLGAIRERYGLRAGMSDDALRGIRDVLLDREPLLATQPEMYNLAEMRDFLLHAHEDPFTIPRIEAMLSANGLEFLGFEELPRAVIESWETERAGEWTSLAAWDAFEQRHPATFVRMYRLLAWRKD